MPLVHRTQTKPSLTELANALRYGWSACFDSFPSVVTLATLFAQWAFETGWGNACWNWNLGNHRTGPLNPPTAGGYSGSYVELPGADEYVNGKRVIVGGYFRAYSDIMDGATGHIRLLDSLPRYKIAMDELHEGDSRENARAFARNFAHSLKVGGYYTGDEMDYGNGLASIAESFIAHMPEDSTPETLPLYALDPKRFDQDTWYPAKFDNAYDALAMLYDAESSARSHLVEVLSCRYDCAEVSE